MVCESGTLNSLNLNEAQKSFISSVINQMGVGDHPMASEESLPFFRIPYVKGLLENNLESFSEEGMTIYNSLPDELTDNTQA